MQPTTSVQTLAIGTPIAPTDRRRHPWHPRSSWRRELAWGLAALAGSAGAAGLTLLVHRGLGSGGLALLLIPVVAAGQRVWSGVERRRGRDTLATGLVETLGEVDPYTRDHSLRVAVYAERLARALGLARGEIEDVRLTGLLHDLGKIAQAPSVLRKPTRLDDEERRSMEQHPVAGARILEKIDALGHIARSIRHHHERMDGRGYPDGLRGVSIPHAARVVLVADAFDAMTSDRTYRHGMPASMALAEIERHQGSQFDPRVVAVLGELVRRRAFAVLPGAAPAPPRKLPIKRETIRPLSRAG